jgi:hypothetical protein
VKASVVDVHCNHCMHMSFAITGSAQRSTPSSSSKGASPQHMAACTCSAVWIALHVIGDVEANPDHTAATWCH